jgi:branched-chain amino acid transport system permease protein
VAALNTELTGGALGLYITFTGDPWQLQFRDNRAYYYLALALMLVATGVVAAVERSRFGAYLAAIREDEDAAEALGVNTFRCKLAAMVLSASLTGLGGAFYANYLFSLQPNAVFGIPLSVDIVIRAVIGGAGTLPGPILGAFILAPLAEISRIYLGQTGFFGAHLVVYGLLLVAVVLFLPRGAYPALTRVVRRAGSSGPPLPPVGGGGGLGG